MAVPHTCLYGIPAGQGRVRAWVNPPSVCTENPVQSRKDTRIKNTQGQYSSLKAPPAVLVPSPAPLETSPQAGTHPCLLVWVMFFYLFSPLFTPQSV